jgi:hypothetical protein
MTIPAFFLKESNKKEGNEKVDKLNGFIRGWIPKTKLFSTNLFMTIPAFFLKESNKKEGNEKVDKLNGFYFGSPI